jgi:hypothetical protein
MQAFVADTGTDGFDQVVDPDGSLWLQFGAEIRSSFLFVDDDGSVQRTGFGEMTPDRLSETVQGLIDS